MHCFYMPEHSHTAAAAPEVKNGYHKKYGTVLRGAIIVEFSSVSVKYLQHNGKILAYKRLGITGKNQLPIYGATKAHTFKDFILCCALDFALQCIIEAQYAGHIPTAIAVVWCRPHRHQRPVCTASRSASVSTDTTLYTLYKKSRFTSR